MDLTQLADYANHGLSWIGFGTVLGLLAQSLLPRQESGGTVATIMMGIAGTLIGCALLRYFYPTQIVDPISVEGFAVGAGGAFVLLLFYNVLGGYWYVDGESNTRRHRFARRRISID